MYVMGTSFQNSCFKSLLGAGTFENLLLYSGTPPVGQASKLLKARM